MALPDGVYRISRWGTFEQPQVLTLEGGDARNNGDVTISPPNNLCQEVTYYFLI